MLTTTELIEATDAVVYPHYPMPGMRRGEAERQARATAMLEYRAAHTALESQWAEWLADEYASDFSSAGQVLIFRQAWEDGHSSGYQSVESSYEDLANFVRAVNNA